LCIRDAVLAYRVSACAGISSTSAPDLYLSMFDLVKTLSSSRCGRVVRTEIGVMSNKDFFEHARECFRQAAEGTNPDNIRLLVELGLEYLRLAHGDPTVTRTASGTRLRLH
jgi:hypothetical protein